MTGCQDLLRRAVKIVESSSPTLLETLETILADPDIGQHDREKVVRCAMVTTDLAQLTMLTHLVWEDSTLATGPRCGRAGENCMEC